MGQVVAILWAAGPTPVEALALIRAGERAGWSAVCQNGGVWLGVAGPRPPSVRRLHAGQTLLVGQTFPNGPEATSRMPADAIGRARHLVSNYWGRYLAFFQAGDGAFSSVLRDPSGAIDCATWTQGPCTVVASCLPDWLVGSGARRWRPDLDTVADILSDPTLLSGPIPLDGVTSVAPGQWRSFDGQSRMLWRPADQARAASNSREVEQPELRAAVDLAVHGLSQDGEALVEVSGGLDSAIVASARQALHPDQRAVCTNVWGPYGEADERTYAEAACARMGVPLIAIERTRPTGDGDLCLTHPRSLRPSINRMDARYDRDQAAQARNLGLDLILTGKGGDVAFYQTATSAILADLLRDRGLQSVADPCLPTLARRMRRSAWSVLWRALAASRRAASFRGAGRPPLGLVAGDVAMRRPAPHPWLEDLDHLPPGKRQQVTGFAGNLSLHGLSERTDAAELVHPLLSQPVMEACLRTPSYILTGGGHDRLLARHVFADRLPPEILDRRSKGELGAYYGQVVAAAVIDLKPHLLEGRLSAAGLIDRAQIEAALRPDHLIWQGGYGDLLLLALIESWLRSWD